MGPIGLSKLQGCSAQHRHRAPGELGVFGACGFCRCPCGRYDSGLPRYPCRHRFAYDDDQRSRRAGLGRGRHRGGGGHAGATGLHADSAGGRLSLSQCAAGGSYGHRFGFDGYGDATQEGRGGQVRGVLRPRPSLASPCRSRNGGEYGAGIWGNLWYLPHRQRIASLPPHVRPLRRADRACGGLHEGAGAFPRLRCARSFLLRDLRTRSQHRGAFHCRPAAPARSHPAFQREKGLGAGPSLATRAWHRLKRSDRTGYPCEGGDGEGHLRAEPRFCCYRRHHKLYEHLEPLRHGGGRPVGKKGRGAGLESKPWVKTSLAPGSRVVTRYLEQAGLLPYLEQLRFATVGYGCTTCIGNSGPLPPEVSRAIEEGKLVVCSVLSGNRNFEGRIQPEVRANYLMSPPLVVAYALAGHMDFDPYNDPLGMDKEGNPVYLRHIWPTQQEVAETIEKAVRAEMFRENYADVFKGDENWNRIDSPRGALFSWDSNSTYIKNPPYFDNMPREAPETVEDIRGARVLAMFGDSITTDHISPAGSIKPSSPAGRYLIERGVDPADFNSYGARRGHDEVMVRGTFANVRIKNLLVPGTEGGVTIYFPTGEVMTIYEAAMRYKQDGTPLIVLAGKEYGSGSSRDWAAKGPYLQGVRAVLAESFERIHRSNLVGMGILPIQYRQGESAATLGLTGRERYDILGLREAIATGFANGRELTVQATAEYGSRKEFRVLARIDTPQEVQYYRHGGILQYVLRQLLETA